MKSGKTSFTHAEISGVTADQHHPATKAVWAQPHQASGTGAVLASLIGRFGASEFANNQIDHAYFSVPLPTGFTALTKAVIRLVALASGNLYLDTATNAVALGENYSDNTQTIGPAAIAVVANKMREYDISGALPSLSVGDTIGILLTRDASNALDTSEGIAYILGVLLEYT